MAYQCLKLDYLELMAGGDATDRRRLLEMLEKDLKHYPALMEETLNNKEWEKLERQAHYFKSTVPFTGYDDLITIHQSAFQELQEGGNRERVSGLLKEVKERCKEVITEVQTELSKG
ncbi:MAG: hypothetical protein HRU12_16995 [Phaeodactylibacter sp.]|nr:hypothetical protein [Phaeodactylibacter sp.]